MLWTFRCLLILLLITIASCIDAIMDGFLEDGTTTNAISTTILAPIVTTTFNLNKTERTMVNLSNIKSMDEENIQDPSHASSPSSDTIWECPNITKAGVECSCDFPHTLRCTGDRTALQIINKKLKFSRPGTISLLDVTITGISLLPSRFLEDVALHGLVVSSGELKRIHENAFVGFITPLQALGLPNNLLDSVPTTALSHLIGLERLDLSQNKLKMLEAGSFKDLSNLTYLDLCDNLLSQLSPQAFAAVPLLRSLRMRGNRLSVSALSALRGLKSLEELDLSNNLLLGPMGPNLLPQMPRLRFLTVSLKSLQDLRLDDNDITMVASDVPTSKLRLTRLSLADNPLNCDCTLLEFANWLSNSSLNEEDKSSAVCATPPALENGILTQVSPGNLLCGEPTPPIMTRLPLAGAQLTLKEFHYDKSTGINLLWHVEPCTERYTCDTLIVYETIGDTENETDSSSLHCDSRIMRDPCSLPITIPASLHLQLGHKYRYCVVLLVPNSYDDVSLGLGCSDVITLEESECELSVVVFDAESAVHKQKLNCSLTFVTLAVLLPGRYKVCASLDDVNEEDVITNFIDNRDRLRCVEVQKFKQNTELIVLTIIGASCALLIIIAIIGRSVLKRLRHPRIQTQCFLPAQEFEITHKAHYIKLLATTKV